MADGREEAGAVTPRQKHHVSSAEDLLRDDRLSGGKFRASST
jgi:hypothetical protein